MFSFHWQEKIIGWTKMILQATGNPKAFTYSWALDGGDMAGDDYIDL